ncbi:hypothetical protein QTO34_008985 [Cnephaeus nilssonii]|uniref:Uncharacterized protein n=1 Tax=Cnephaeus nilssonii TaxID=3371016 RepID=A0AA40HH13_CNENI|nr:hypothetical protein QTO34_008985 [Eptesicus nilssonii]
MKSSIRVISAKGSPSALRPMSLLQLLREVSAIRSSSSWTTLLRPASGPPNTRNRIIQFNPGPDKYFILGLPTGALVVNRTFNVEESFLENVTTPLCGTASSSTLTSAQKTPTFLAESGAFEDKIEAAGGMELFVPMAFNEPGSSLASRACVKDTILASARCPRWPWHGRCHGYEGGDNPYHKDYKAPKAFALYKATEEGVSHMWTVSAFQEHPRTVFVCDEDATWS